MVLSDSFLLVYISLALLLRGGIRTARIRTAGRTALRHRRSVIALRPCSPQGMKIGIPSSGVQLYLL